ncbi:MAG: hypothetical protein AAB386_02680 [Patescibacteria group bacterium]
MKSQKEIAVTLFMCAQFVFMYFTVFIDFSKRVVWPPLLWWVFLVANIAWVVISMLVIDWASALAGVCGVFLSILAIVKIRANRKKFG